MDYVHPAEREAERLRVIIQTLATSSPEMTMFTAAPAIFEIEKKTAELERVQVAPVAEVPGYPGHYSGTVFALPDNSPQTAAKFVDLCPPIQAFMPHKKINAIKELRARTGLGLKEAKDGIEYWESHHGKSSSTPRPASSSGTGRFPTPGDAARWIEHDPAGHATRTILMVKKEAHYKIIAIKQCRADTALSLKEAKEAVEEWIRLFD